MRRKSIARKVRFHCGWLAVLMLILDAVSQMWFAFEALLPIPPAVYAGLGVGLLIASGVGHLIYKE
jgi:hypothetical protein